MPSENVQRVEIKYSLFKAGFGAISCASIGSACAYFLVVASRLPDVRAAVVHDFVGYVGVGMAALLTFAALYGLPTYLRRLLDRSAVVVFDIHGIHDMRRPGCSVRWSEIREVGLRGLRRNGVVERATLTLFLGRGTSQSMDVEGLDQTPEFMAATAQARISRGRR